MQPTIQQAHIDRPLTNISTAYLQSQENFIASQVFPVVPVEKLSDKFYTYTKDDWFRDEAEKRADTTESAGSGYGVSTDNYSCDLWAFHKDIGDQARNNADKQISVDRNATEFVSPRHLLRQEKQWVTKYFTTGVWGIDLAGGSDFTVWSNLSSGTPNTDVEDQKTAVLKKTGFLPNTLVLGYEVYAKLKNHPVIQNQIKYVQAVTGKTITPALLAAYFDVERVIVAKAIQNTAAEGAAGSYSFVHGKNAWLGYVAKNPGLLTPSAGYIFGWNGVSGGMGSPVGIKKFRMEALSADRVEGEVAFDAKVVGADLGVFFSGAVS